MLGLLAYGARRYEDLGLLGSTRQRDDPDEEHRPERDASFLAWIRQAGRAEGGGAGPAPADLFRRVFVGIEVETLAGRVERAEVAAPFGVRTAWSRTRRHEVIADYDAELACDNSGGGRPSALADPQVTTVEDGVAVDLRVLAGGERGVVSLEAIVQWGTLAEPVDRVSTGARYHGEIDLPRHRGGLAFLSGTVREGEALSATIELEGRPAAIRLRPRVVDLGGGAGPSAIRRLEADLLTLAPWGVARSDAPFAVVRRGEAAAFAEDLASRLEAPDLSAHLGPAGGLWASGTPSALDAAAAETLRLSTPRARTVLADVRAFADDAEIARFSVPALTGRTALLRVGEDRAYLEDADAAVG